MERLRWTDRFLRLFLPVAWVLLIAWLWVLSWTFYPNLRPDVVREFDDWWTRKRAGIDVKTLVWLGWVVIVWIMLSARNALHDIRGELKSINANIKEIKGRIK
jgi:4-amino-4-deoxy-L-arabinose transferase-like glycosyltransferase